MGEQQEKGEKRGEMHKKGEEHKSRGVANVPVYLISASSFLLLLMCRAADQARSGRRAEGEGGREAWPATRNNDNEQQEGSE